MLCLQQNIGKIKVESDVSGLNEENSIGMNNDEVSIPSTFCFVKTEPEVRLVFRCHLWLLFMCVCVFVCVYNTSHVEYNIQLGNAYKSSM
jgi:hypothetical protein